MEHSHRPVIFFFKKAPEEHQIIRKLFDSAGYDLELFAEESEFIVKLICGTCDMAIIDLDLACLGGMRFFGTARSFMPSLPVILLGKSAKLMSFLDVTKESSASCLAKPFSDEELLTAVRDQLTEVQAYRAS